MCFFCLSTCLLTVRKEVRGLRPELGVVKSELMKTKKENERCGGSGRVMCGMIREGSLGGFELECWRVVKEGWR